MYHIKKTFQPMVGTSVTSVCLVAENIQVAEEWFTHCAERLIAENRTFTYLPGSKRQDGTYAQLPSLVADCGERWDMLPGEPS